MVLKRKVGKIVSEIRQQYPALNSRVVGVLVLFCATFFGILYSTLSPAPSHSPTKTLLALAPLEVLQEPDAAKSEPARPVFSYSVIPGGVHSPDELRAALQRDRLAAEHYSGFQVQRAKLMRLREDRQAYVSYRIGNQIFWSSRKVTLHAGEELLSDGKNLARTRCGNRVSADPALPVAFKEPSEATLETPVVHPNPEISTEVLPLGPIWGPDLTPPIESLVNPPPGGSPGGPPTPGAPPIICCSNGPGPHGPVPPPTPPPISTPEPSTLALLLVAAVALAALTLKRRV